MVSETKVSRGTCAAKTEFAIIRELTRQTSEEIYSGQGLPILHFHITTLDYKAFSSYNLSFDVNKPLMQPGRVLFVSFYKSGNWSYKKRIAFFFSRPTRLVPSPRPLSPGCPLQITLIVSFTFACLKCLRYFPKKYFHGNEGEWRYRD